MLRLGIARQDHVASIGCWQVDIDHLHGFEFFQYGTRSQSWRFGFGSVFQRHLQAVTQEADEDIAARKKALVFRKKANEMAADTFAQSKLSGIGEEMWRISCIGMRAIGYCA